MAWGPSSLPCSFCLSPSRPVGGPLLVRPLRLGHLPASLLLSTSTFAPSAAPKRLLSAPFAFGLHWPVLSPEGHGKDSPALSRSPFSSVHSRKANPCGTYRLWSGCSRLESLPPAVAPGPSFLSLVARGISSEAGAPSQLIPLRRRLRAIKRIDPKLQLQVLKEGLGRPRCQRAQRLLKRGDPQSISARCPLFLQQLKPRLKLWKKALTAEELPPPLYPEVAFAGRSNAGKSTLLNELCGRSGTAAVSRRPGSTQELFFFKAGSPCCLCLVDLPGYGYAEANAAKRLQWTEMSLFYLKARPNLKRVFLLVDARWGLKASDICLLSFFERHRIRFQLVLTKADLPEQKSLIKTLQIVTEEVKKFKGCAGPPLAVSALRHRGLDPLRAEIEKLRLSKELIIGRLRLKAANLAEARRLKKEARKMEKAVSSSSTPEQRKAATTPGLTIAAGPHVPQEKPQQQQQQHAHALYDPVARALERWGASTASTANGTLNWGQTQKDFAFAGDKLRGSAAAENPMTGDEGHRRGEPLRLVSVPSQTENGVDALAGAEPEVEDGSSLREKISLSSALSAAVDRAAGALPVPDVSCAEALIRDFLPSPSQTCHIPECVEPQPETPEVAPPEGPEKERNTDATPPLVPVADALHLCSLLDKLTSSRLSTKPAPSAWAASVFREVRFDPPGAAAGSATLQSSGSQEVSFTGYDNGDAAVEVPISSAETSALTLQSPQQVEEQPQLPGKQNLCAVLQDKPWEDSSRHAGKRPLDLLRANDWRARRVGRSAVEIDMGLPETQNAMSNVEMLHLGSCYGDEKTCASIKSPFPSRAGRVALSAEVEGGSGPLPDLSAVLTAQQQQQQQQQQQPKARMHKDSIFRRLSPRASLGGAVFLDEETLAAEDFGCSPTRARGRIGNAPDPSNYTGFHELDMQRSFDQKWRHELLPVGDASQAIKVGNSKAAERHGPAGVAQRNKSGCLGGAIEQFPACRKDLSSMRLSGLSNPFRIPEDYIGTSEDRTRVKTKRLALEIRLQRAQEAHRPTDGSHASEERNRSTADSLLFSAAQRRQERRLKELAKKSNKNQGRSKEMTWDVAYRKWARWARAHPTLAREAPRPSKAQLLAAFRQKLEKKANRRRKYLHQRSAVAQPAVAGGQLTARQSIEHIRKEAREVSLHEDRR